MQDLKDNDEQFERYLQHFRPLDAEPMASSERAPTARRWFAFAARAAAAAAIAIVAVVLTRAPKPVYDVPISINTEWVATPRPLTIGTANALLAQSKSIKKALNGIAFQRQKTQPLQGKRSAIDVLSKENTRL